MPIRSEEAVGPVAGSRGRADADTLPLVRRLVAALLCCALGGAMACGDRARSEPVAAGSLAVIGGAADATHASVVSIVAQAGTNPELCSGTVIAPRVVLTAGHCTLGQDPAGLVVGIGTSAAALTRSLAVAAVFTYPAYTGTNDLPGGTDLGAVILAEDSGVASVPLFAGSGASLVGSSAMLVGYGESSASDQASSGTRLSASVAVSAACSAVLSFGDATTNACHGDSGGPLLVLGDGGIESIAAVVSNGDDLHCVTASHAVRVDRYTAWIADVLAGTAPGDGGACASCPPDAVDCEGDDAGPSPEADAASTPDASDAGVDEAPSPSSGGCSVRGAGTATEPSWALALGCACGIALCCRRGRRARLSARRGAPGSARRSSRASRPSSA